MKQLKFFAALAFACAFSSSCIYSQGGYNDDYLTIAASELDLENDRSERGGRLSRNSRSACYKYKECADICEDVYDLDSDSEAGIDLCLELDRRTAEEFEGLLYILENPEERGLDSIDLDIFADFLGVSVGPWVEKVIEELDDDGAKALLIWIAKTPQAAQAIADSYSNYEADYEQFQGVEELFKELRGDYLEELSGSLNFEDIACRSQNDYALAIYENLEGSVISCRGLHAYSRPENFPIDLFYKGRDSLLNYVVTVESLIHVCPASVPIGNFRSSVESCRTLSCERDLARESGCITSPAMGSGVFDERGKVLTNWHVVDNLTVKEGVTPDGEAVWQASFRPGIVTSYSGESSRASIQWYDRDSDIALLTLNDSNMGPENPTPRLSSLSEIKIGEKLIAIGQPGGRQWVISQGRLRGKNGVIRGRHQCVNCLAYDFPDIVAEALTRLFSNEAGVEHDQPGIIGGSSGGPIFNKDGRLVGLIALAASDSSKTRSRGWGWGPHIDRIKHLLERSRTGDVSDQ